MTNETEQTTASTLLATMRAARDALSVGRVYGQAYEFEGRTVIPVAAVRGGGGAGAGEGQGPESIDGVDGAHAADSVADSADGAGSGSGFGTGFGMTARPVGVYVVDADGVEWKPAVDVGRLAKGGQLLAALVTVCVTAVALRRRAS